MPNTDLKPFNPPALYDTSPGLPSTWLTMWGPQRDAGGGDVADLMGRAPAGTRTGGCTWGVGPYGPCLNFNGATGMVSWPSQTWGMGNAWTVTCAARIASAAGGGGECLWQVGLNPAAPSASAAKLSFGDGAAGSSYVYLVGSSGSSFKFYSGLPQPPTPTEYAVTWDGASLKVYVNGADVTPGLSKDTDNAGTMADTPRPAYLGSGFNASQVSVFNGQIFYTKFYPRALSAAEVARDYAGPWRQTRPEGPPRRLAAGSFVPPVVLAPAAAPSAETLTGPTLAAGAVAAAPGSIGTGETLTAPGLGAGTVTLAPGAVPPGATLTGPGLAAGAVAVAPGGVTTGEAVPAPAASSVIYYDPAEALKAFFLGRPDLRAATADGKLWEQEAKEGTQYPFAEFFLVSEADDEATTGPFKVVRSVLQLSCHDSTQQGAKDLRNRFEAALYQAPLVVQGQPALNSRPQSPASGKGEGKGPGGKDSWMATVDVEVLWVKPQPMLFRS